jgi:hypothetical protein
MAEDNFTVWFASKKNDTPEKRGGKYAEPAEAADRAEAVLTSFGYPEESRCEIRFNGDAEPHTVIFLLDREGGVPTFGIWNTASAMWPIFYADDGGGQMLDGDPFNEGSEDDDDENESDGFGDKDDDSKLMDLGGGMDDDDEDESEDDDEDEESPEDENDEEGEDDSPDPESEDENGDETEEGDEELEADGDDEEDGENETDQEETEMPRLKIFAKMRGPKGWRKRAEAEELNERNVFGLKVGVLDPQEDMTSAQQERNVVAHVEFIEHDTTRDHGVLKLRLPEGVSLADFTQTKAGVISVDVPYPKGS